MNKFHNRRRMTFIYFCLHSLKVHCVIILSEKSIQLITDQISLSLSLTSAFPATGHFSIDPGKTFSRQVKINSTSEWGYSKYFSLLIQLINISTGKKKKYTVTLSLLQKNQCRIIQALNSIYM